MTILAINKRVFDGDEQSFYAFRSTFQCPSCGKEIVFCADDMSPIEDVDLASLPKGFEKKLNLRHRAGETFFENHKGLRSHAVQCSCNDCSARLMVVAGIGEVQPSRFNVVVEGIIVL